MRRAAFCLLAIASSLAPLLVAQGVADAAPCPGIAIAHRRAPKATRAVVVRSPAGSWAKVDLIVGGRATLCGVPARIGIKGLRPLTRRRAGDGTTPSGVFGVGVMTAPNGDRFHFFGNGTNPGVPASQWHKVQPGDCWDATPGDRAYNTLVKRSASACGAPDEYLPKIVNTYSRAALIDANMGAQRSGDNPSEPAFAAAIFLHRHSYDSRGNTKATHGCVSLNATNLAIVMRALKPGVSAFVIG